MAVPGHADRVVASSAGPGFELGAALRSRLPELEQATLDRILAISASGTGDLSYVDGLRAAVPAALRYGVAAIEQKEGGIPPIPATVLVQARLAARNGIGLDTVLRRYFAGVALLSDQLIELEWGAAFDGATWLKGALHSLGAAFDGLIAAVSEEYQCEAERRLETAEQRRAERVRRMLDGELWEDGQLGYELDGHHVGIVACGHGAEPVLRELAHGLDRRLLLVHPEANTAWAWLGGRRTTALAEIERLKSAPWPDRAVIALGESAEGPIGWRLTHRQAAAALPVALRRSVRFVRYADVALLTACLRDDLLATSLRERYLRPLEDERDQGEVARQTLRAYFVAGCNVSSAAAALGVNRSTVSSRLHSIEQQIGVPLDSNRAELEVALGLAKLGSAVPAPHLARYRYSNRAL